MCAHPYILSLLKFDTQSLFLRVIRGIKLGAYQFNINLTLYGTQT